MRKCRVVLQYPMGYADLNSELLTRFPELFGGYTELKAMWDGDEPGPHVLYGDVLVPHLRRVKGMRSL